LCSGGRRRENGAAARKSGKTKKLEELVLPNAKLRFCREQLQNLNYIFNKRLERNVTVATEKQWMLARSVTERLVQRLICAAGILDPRFATKYLICDCIQNNPTSNKLKYMVRLDSLSTPSVYEADARTKYSVIETDSDYPAAYARIRLHTSSFKVWGDYTNSSGYLRRTKKIKRLNSRDKVQARLVELLALAASKDVPNSPLHVDESVLCGIPGKVVDSVTLHNILKIPPEQHVYYGPGGNVPRFPDPRDFRLAIVDEPGGIKLRVEFLSPALSSISIDVRIFVAIGVDAWPSSTDFPSRISLGHSDCLLYHKAALTVNINPYQRLNTATSYFQGMYLVGYGVQSSAWQIRVPASEFSLLNHFGPNSTVRTALEVLLDVMEDIDEARNFGKQQQISYKILNSYILTTVLLEELEEGSSNPVSDMINWSPIGWFLKGNRIIFFKKSNLLLNPGHLSDDDFRIEASNVKGVMLRFFDESLMSTKANEEFGKLVLAQETEMALLYKWKDLVDGLLPPPGTRGRRFCFAGSKNRTEVAHTQYTLRQLEYIGLLLHKMLIVKQHVLQANYTMLDDSVHSGETEHEHPLEDVIFILVTVMDQARDQYLSTQTNPSVEKNKLRIKSNYNTCTSKLVDLMRKDAELQSFNFEDDLVLVKLILKWLYRAMDQNKRHLAPILRPYLNNLFTASHAVSWHIDAIKGRGNEEEVATLGSFAEQVNAGKITPAQGLTDCVTKNLGWAKNMLGMVQKNTLRVVFIPGRGQVGRHILSLPSHQNKKELGCGSKTLGASTDKHDSRKELTLPGRSYFSTILREKAMDTKEDITPEHDRLKKNSPLTMILNSVHRRGDHRGEGDIFEALKSMQKLNMFQEVATSLPQEDRKELSDLIRSVQAAKTKKSLDKKWSSTLPQANLRAQAGFGSKNESIQRYIPKEESAGIRIRDPKLQEKLKNHSTNSLLGTCRAARIREDNSIFLLHDSFKVKSLLHKSESFKY
ncbi:hypothetical protein NQ315_001649, partial [Exocentrus adspersus]